MIDLANLVPIIVATIAALSALASQRSAAKVAKAAKIESAKLALENSRVDMEKNAYERARAFDTETIARQNKRIAELRREVRRLETLVARLRTRIDNVDHLDEQLEEDELDSWDFDEPKFPDD